jgi:hypothetical protein
MKLVKEDSEPNNITPVIKEIKQLEKENKIKKYESPIRKMIKKENILK